MKLPVVCPICNDVMLTEYPGVDTIAKICARRLDHRLCFMASSTDEYQIVKTIKLEPRTGSIECVRWLPTLTLLSVESENLKKIIRIPYFEPNFSDHHRLISKIKTYILFS